MSWFKFKPYVPVAQRRANAAREVAKRCRKGLKAAPVRIEGREVAKTFWGKAWCTNLESYSDFANRLPRGLTYVRNGSVVHLQICKGKIEALVSGSELYEVEIDISALSRSDWKSMKEQCAGRIDSLVELLQGKLSKGVMETVTDRQHGLFPKPREIEMSCSCPDYAGMCKHVAAVMYGIGNRLDSQPELLFELRAVDVSELIDEAVPASTTKKKSVAPTIAAEDLGSVFGIEIDATPAPVEKPRSQKKPAVKKAAASSTKATAGKKAAAKKAPSAKKAKSAPARKRS